MRRRKLFAVLILALLPISSISALTEYQSSQITRYLDSPAMEQDKSIFDGKAFKAGVTVQQAQQYLNNFTKAMNQAVRGWNMLSNSDKRSAEAQELLKRLQPATVWQKAMYSAFPAFKKVQANKTPAPSSTSSMTP